MRVLKTRWFARWARKEGLTDTALRSAVDEMRGGLVDAVLGGGLIKKRIARPGGGKSGGYRTLLAADFRDRWVFLYGFAKSERENIGDGDLRELRRLAQEYLSMGEAATRRLVGMGVLMEVSDGKPETS
jgi:hypothetical protein